MYEHSLTFDYNLTIHKGTKRASFRRAACFQSLEITASLSDFLGYIETRRLNLRNAIARSSA